MNDAHLHLALNHLPIIIPFVAVLVLIGGIVFKSEIIKRTALLIFVLGAICTLPAFATGEGAEEVVEELQGIDHHFIHEHEEVAETFALLSYALGLLAIVGLWANLKKKNFSNLIAIVVLLFSGVVLFFAKQTGTTGGEVRHTEIRGN
jgi:uncharacterized membrane protein